VVEVERADVQARQRLAAQGVERNGHGDQREHPTDALGRARQGAPERDAEDDDQDVGDRAVELRP
jgi:hypothetical protein